MLYGHRRDTEGYAKALEHFDSRLPEIESAMRADDVMMITADHGNDPTFRGSDHTREYAPLLVYGKNAQPGVDLGTRDSLADIGQTIANNFGLRLNAGHSFLDKIRRQDSQDHRDLKILLILSTVLFLRGQAFVDRLDPAVGFDEACAPGFPFVR